MTSTSSQPILSGSSSILTISSISPSSGSASTSTVPYESSISTASLSRSASSTSRLPSASTAHASYPNKSHLSNGEVAGVAVATAIVGALIAAAFVFLLMSSRRKKQSSNNKQEMGEIGYAAPPRIRDAPGDQSRSEKPARSTNVDLVLPQPLDDKSVVAEVEKFFMFVDGHVDSGFYHDMPINAGTTIEEQLGRRSSPLPLGIRAQSGPKIETLLADQSSRASAITSLICAEVLSGIDFGGDPDRSLLPLVVTSFVRSTVSGNKETHANRLSLSRWRVSTALLLGESVHEVDRQHRDRAVQLLIQDINATLQPFLTRGHEDKRNLDLLSICKRAEKLGIVLLSQPAEWAFEWRWGPTKREGRDDARQSLVVLPGLIKVTDESATAFERPRVLVKPKHFS